MNVQPLPVAPLVRGGVVTASPLRETLDIERIVHTWATTARCPTLVDEATGAPLGCSPADRARFEQAAGRQLRGIRVALAMGGQVLTRPRSIADTTDTVDTVALGTLAESNTRRVVADLSPTHTLAALDTGAIVVFVGIDTYGDLRVGLVPDPDAPLPLITNDSTSEGEHGQGLHMDSLRHNAHQLNDDDTQCALALSALSYWHDATRYCQRCGGRLVAVHCGWVRKCQDCERLEYPRQDPAMIVSITNERGEILLAHNALWEERRVSVLAGFLDAGEAPDQAVRREIREEVGLDVKDVTFMSSQPWPFPRSLMLAYHATANSDDPLRPDKNEIAWAEWFSPHSLREAVANGRIILPGVNTIAYGLISQWYGGPLPSA